MKTNHITAQSILYALLLCFVALPVSGQTPNTEYFMKSSYQRSNLNPALRARQGHVGFPALTNLSADFKTNTLNLDHLVFDGPGNEKVTFLHPSVGAEQFLDDISENNYLNASVYESIFTWGSYAGDNGYWFFDIAARSDIGANIPYSFFEFAKKGMSLNETSYYNLKDIRVVANLFADLGVGYSHDLLDKSLVVGAKAKVLLGYASADVLVKEAMINATSDQWIINSHITGDITIPGDIILERDEDDKFDGFDLKPKSGIGGFGLGLDLGATLNLSGVTESLFGDNPITDVLNRFTVSLAFTDIGFISWNKGSSKHIYTELEETVVTGDYQIDLNDSNSLKDDLDAMADKLEEFVNLKEKDASGRTTSLHTNMNIGLEYEVLPEQLTVGLLSTTRFNPIHTISELTVGGSYRPTSWFEAGLTYSMVFNHFNTIGLAIHFAPKRGANFFLATDYFLPKISKEFIPVTSKGANLMVGVSFPIGARR